MEEQEYKKWWLIYSCGNVNKVKEKKRHNEHNKDIVLCKCHISATFYISAKNK